MYNIFGGEDERLDDTLGIYTYWYICYMVLSVGNDRHCRNIERGMEKIHIKDTNILKEEK